MKLVSLDHALLRRAELILQAIALVTKDQAALGEFADYQAKEPLVPSLVHFDGGLYCEYRRLGRSEAAAVRFYNFTMTDIDEVHRRPPAIVRNAVTEKADIHVDIEAPVRVQRTVSHEFTHTTTFAEAATKSWEVAAKASLSLELAYVKAALEVSGKYGESYTSSSGETDTERDTETDVFEFTGPQHFIIEAFRSRDRVKQLVTARCDFDFSIAIDPQPAPGILYWPSFRADFLPALQRLAPSDVEYAAEFRATPATETEVRRIEAVSGKLVQFPVTFDNVLTQSLTQVP